MIAPNRNKLKLGITPGDPNGIGYEILIKIFSDARILDMFTPIVYGSRKVFEFYLNKIGHMLPKVNPVYIENANKCNFKKLNFVDIWPYEFQPEPGSSSENAGKIAIKSLQVATEECMNGTIDAIVTGPIDKNNTYSDEFPFVGHTEFLKAKFKTENDKDKYQPLMFMISDNIKVGLVTMHKALLEVPSYITRDNILKHIELIRNSLVMDFSSTNPKIAVLSLNPHSGDNGVIGKEENDVIIPAITEAESKGYIVAGPFSSDGFFGSGAYTKYDAVLAMYHDQGLIPFKAMAMYGGVNFTAGLPIVRTSPAHGVGYDIAGVGAADPSSFRYAMYKAIDIVNSRKIFSNITANPVKYIKKHSSDKIQKEQNVDEMLSEVNIDD